MFDNHILNNGRPQRQRKRVQRPGFLTLEYGDFPSYSEERLAKEESHLQSYRTTQKIVEPPLPIERRLFTRRDSEPTENGWASNSDARRPRLLTKAKIRQLSSTSQSGVSIGESDKTPDVETLMEARMAGERLCPTRHTEEASSKEIAAVPEDKRHLCECWPIHLPSLKRLVFAVFSSLIGSDKFNKVIRYATDISVFIRHKLGGDSLYPAEFLSRLVKLKYVSMLLVVDLPSVSSAFQVQQCLLTGYVSLQRKSQPWLAKLSRWPAEN
ncbi:hypothetical protein AAHC03_027174 [Spirometra sp. Aus1]